MSIKSFIKRLFNARLYKKIGGKWSITILLFLVWVIFFDSNSIIQCSRIHSNIREQEKKKILYRGKIDSVERKIEEFEHNRDSLEKFARERFLFKEEDEELYIVDRERLK